MTNYNDGSWHGWNGGECPVHPRSVVEIVYQDDGAYRNNEAIVSHCDWGKGCSSPIVAFRVIYEHKVPREFWLCGYTICTKKESADRVNMEKHDGLMEIIHVREVLE